jgi:hypothetical protein
MLHYRVLIDECVEAASGKTAELGILDRFGAERMLIVDADPEEVAGTGETNDLTTSVGQLLVEFQAADCESEHAGRWIAFVKQRLASPQPQFRPEIPELREPLAVQHSANRPSASFAALAGMSVA